MLYPVPGRHGYGYAVRAPYSGLAIASLVAGILSVLIMCWVPVSLFPAAGAVIVGHLAMVKLKDPAVPRLGMGMAISGLVTGYVSLAVGILLLAAVIHSAVTT